MDSAITIPGLVVWFCFKPEKCLFKWKEGAWWYIGDLSIRNRDIYTNDIEAIARLEHRLLFNKKNRSTRTDFLSPKDLTLFKLFSGPIEL